MKNHLERVKAHKKRIRKIKEAIRAHKLNEDFKKEIKQRRKFEDDKKSTATSD